MPRPIVERLNAEIVKGLAAADVNSRLTNAGYDPATSTPDKLGEMIKSELAKWGKVVKASGAKVE